MTVSFDVVAAERTVVAHTSKKGRYERLVVNVDEKVVEQRSDRTSHETIGCREALRDAYFSPEWRPARQTLTSAAVKPPSLGLMFQAVEHQEWKAPWHGTPPARVRSSAVRVNRIVRPGTMVRGLAANTLFRAFLQRVFCLHQMFGTVCCTWSTAAKLPHALSVRGIACDVNKNSHGGLSAVWKHM